MPDEQDPKVSAAYRELAAEEPPRALDEAILAAARHPLAGERKAARPWTQRYAVPLGLAAVLVLSVTVTFRMQYQRPRIESPIGTAGRRADLARRRGRRARPAGRPAAGAGEIVGGGPGARTRTHRAAAARRQARRGRQGARGIPQALPGLQNDGRDARARGAPPTRPLGLRLLARGLQEHRAGIQLAERALGRLVLAAHQRGDRPGAVEFLREPD